MKGLIKLTEKHKKFLKELVEDACESCDKTEEEVGTLQIHRIIRGNDGGRYVPHNIRVLCKRCHKMMHGGEFT